mgnify:CR=1 FL=1
MAQNPHNQASHCDAHSIAASPSFRGRACCSRYVAQRVDAI